MRHPGGENRQRMMSRILTAVAVVVDRTQFPPSDRVQILPESTVLRKNLYKFERKWSHAAALSIRQWFARVASRHSHTF